MRSGGDVEIQQLRYLVAAADASSYAQAAKTCFTSRQNVAHAVKSIEGELGISIFERQGNAMVPTPEGLQVIHKARQVLSKVDEMESMFTSIEDADAPLNVTMGVNFLAGIPPEVDQYFAIRANSLHFSEHSPEQCYQHVLSGDADVAFVMCMQRTYAGVKTVDLYRSRAYALASTQCNLSAAGITVDDLQTEHLLLMSAPPFQYQPLFARLEALGCSDTSVSIIPSTSTMLHMVRRGDSIGIVSERFNLHPPRGTVAIPFLDSRLDWRFVALYDPESKRAGLVRRLVLDVKEQFTNME